MWFSEMLTHKGATFPQQNTEFIVDFVNIIKYNLEINF